MGFFDKVKDILNEEDNDDFEEFYDDSESSFSRSSRSSKALDKSLWPCYNIPNNYGRGGKMRK